jgi:hypothetical protein
MAHKPVSSNGKLLRAPRDRTIRALNDLYVLAGLTAQSLLEMQERVREGELEDEIEFEAPSSDRETTVVTRDVGELSKLLQVASASGVYQQSLVTAVAVAEDYLQSVLKQVLRWFPEKLKLNVEGRNTDKTIELDLVLRSSTVEDILDSAISKQLLSIFYGSPDRYFQYIESILSVKIEKELKDSFAEIKATRDIIVHNSGIANEVYAEKAGTKARSQPGKLLKNDKAYFGTAIKVMKKLCITIFSQALKKFGNSPTRSSKR